MNDDETFDALDRRGRQAAAALRERVADRPVPAFDPDVLRVPIDGPIDGPTERGRPGRRGLLLIAAVVALVLGVGVALARTGTSDDATPPATVPARDLNRYVLAEPPAGLPLSFASSDSRAAGERFGEVWLDGRMTVYGPSVEDPRLGMVAFPHSDMRAETPDDLPAVDIGARDAWDASALFGAGALWVDVEGRPVLVYGALEPELVREVAATVEVDGDLATIPEDARPDGWQELGIDVDRGDASWTAVYRDPAATGVQPFMVLSVISGGRLDVTSLLLVGDGATEVEVRGHPGVLVERPASEHADHSVTVRWEERPGEVVELVSSSPEDPIDPDEVLALVEDLDVMSADEASGLVTRLRREVIEATGATIVGEGLFPDGSAWILASGAEPIDPWSLSVDGRVDPWDDIWSVGEAVPVTPDGGTPATEPGSAGAGGFTLDAQVGRTRDDLVVAYGAVTPGTAAVEVRTPAGDVLAPAEVVTAVDGSLAGWVAELPDDVGIDEASGPEIVVVALDATGAELARLAF